MVVVDYNSRLARRVREGIHGVRVVENDGRRGLSGAKNTGLRTTEADLVAFLDDDAVAESPWLERLIAQVEQPGVAVAGGAVVPAWTKNPPAWFPGLFGWVVGCDYDGLPEGVTVVRNVFGGNMIVRRDIAMATGGFREDSGRIGTIPLGCEETEFCLRVSAETAQSVVRDPSARIHHVVPQERTRVTYVVRRCFYEGVSKAQMARVSETRHALAPERSYAAALVKAIWVDGREALFELDQTAARRGALTVAGAVAALLGFARGRIASSRR